MKLLGRLALALAASALALFFAEGLYRRQLRKEALSENAYELYAVGESTAEGWPYPRALSFPSLVADAFDGRLGGRPIAVLNLAHAGDTAYPQTLALRRALAGRNRENPAVVLIYIGHNERFGAGGSAALGVVERLVSPSLLLSELTLQLERRWGRQAPRDHETYAAFLREMIRASREAGAVPVLSTVVGNVRGVEPEPVPGAPDGGEPLALYREAESRAARGNWPEARRLYWAALDASPRRSFGRADSRQNGIIKEIARSASVPLVDSLKTFEDASAHGIPGDELFGDGNHPNLRGHLLLAKGFTAAVARIAHEAPGRALEHPDALLRAAGIGPAQLANAFVVNGVTMLTVSGGRPELPHRLALARVNFAAAAALEPKQAWAWLGLAVAGCDADARRDLDWIFDDFRNGRRACAGAAALARALDELREHRAPTAPLERLSALRGDADSCIGD